MICINKTIPCITIHLDRESLSCSIADHFGRQMVLYPPVDQLMQLDVDPMFDMRLNVPGMMGIRDRRDSSDRK